MKKTNAILILMVLMMSAAAFALTGYETPDQKSIRIKNTRYEPFPVEPGNYFELWVRVENFGSSDITNFQFRLVPEYPFSLDPNEEAEREFGLLEAGGQALFNFKIRTDINAVEGSNPLKYEYTFTGGKWNDGQFNINIYTLDPILSIADVVVEKERVAPGEEVGVEIKLKNLADSTLKDVNVKLNFVEVVQTATGFEMGNLPISPMGSSDEKTIKIMEGGAEESVGFNLIVDSSAESTVYKIPVTITYNDMQGINYTKNTIISMIVGSEPDLVVTIDTSTANMAGKVGDVTVKFVNKGFSEIKFLYLTLEENGDFEIISPPEVYLGNVDSDDYESADYRVYVSPEAKGEVILPLTIDYRDTNNNHYVKKLNLKNRIYTSKEAKMFGIEKGNSVLGIVVLLLIVGGGLYIYRRVKKRKKKK
ncbi:hypothetical protein JW707_04720 [Candidatus Woesearchaeota archaeon]|nr:hypothetical protein [Candidatus Woesearchaeota archaeon]